MLSHYFLLHAKMPRQLRSHRWFSISSITGPRFFHYSSFSQLHLLALAAVGVVFQTVARTLKSMTAGAASRLSDCPSDVTPVSPP